jgi:hypothetical protein
MDLQAIARASRRKVALLEHATGLLRGGLGNLDANLKRLRVGRTKRDVRPRNVDREGLEGVGLERRVQGSRGGEGRRRHDRKTS